MKVMCYPGRVLLLNAILLVALAMLPHSLRRKMPLKAIIAHLVIVSLKKTVSILEMLLEAEQILVMLKLIKLMVRYHLSAMVEAARRARKRKTSHRIAK